MPHPAPSAPEPVGGGGDVLAAGVVYLGTEYLSAGVARFARANILGVLAALAVAVLLVREHRRLAAAEPAA